MIAYIVLASIVAHDPLEKRATQTDLTEVFKGGWTLNLATSK